MATTTHEALTHPLDPLRADEIREVASILRRERGPGPDFRFVTIALHEPPKEQILAFDGTAFPERQAFVVLFDRGDGKTFEALVSLTHGHVAAWHDVPGAQPGLLPEEYLELDALVKAHPDFRAALARRGIEDVDRVDVDPVPAGYWRLDEDGWGRRLARALAFSRPSERGNCYAKPIEGVVGLVDLNRMEVLSIVDHGPRPIPPEEGAYDAASVGEFRQDVRPLEILQPEGPSFEVEGNEIAWQKWRFRIGFTPREGLVLYTVTYEDGGRRRLVLYRASYSEMAVPYGEASPNHFHQSPFDFGENTVGALANSLELGCDCLGLIRYFDAVVNDSAGEPVPIRNAICLHEEDFGLLWKHFDFRTEAVETRRSRRLVVSWIMTIGNYEYGFYWYLYQDGAIASEVKLTGILQTAAVEPGERPKHGALVAPQLSGMIHQHFFNARLDFDLDGRENTVVEVHTEADPTGPSNPYGNAFYTVETPLARESEVAPAGVVEPLRARSWKIINPNVRNRLGQPVGYRLVPGDNVLPFAQPGSPLQQRLGFATQHVWVTPYDPHELFAAGDYPNQNAGPMGLAAWAERDSPIKNTDVVLWYSFGHHHVPRPEDWPVMPVVTIGFSLKPHGFFEENPALDVPPPRQHACH